MKIGIICPSEIAIRRFMPALKKIPSLEFSGLAVSTPQERFGENYDVTQETQEIMQLEYKKAQEFIDNYGGKIFNGYKTICESDEIDALYIPLPPALHYQWAKYALKNNKHVLLEKPFTTTLLDTKQLIDLAKENNCALHENYMFVFHNQIDEINNIIQKEIGNIRLYRINFGFPRRSINDFRYSKALGGGALIDAGGYTIKYASMLLGKNSHVAYAQSNYTSEFDVDLYGSGALVNDQGLTVQIAFGMDNEYKCEVEAWGSQGYVKSERVLTAPVNFQPTLFLKKNGKETLIQLSSDDTFKKSIEFFISCVDNFEIRNTSYTNILHQAELLDEFNKKTNK